jgi:hypothetical protein
VARRCGTRSIEDTNIVIIHGIDKSKLMEIERFSPDGGQLLFKGRIMGAMPITGVLLPSQARAFLRMLGFRTLLFLMTLPFRRDP